MMRPVRLLGRHRPVPPALPRRSPDTFTGIRRPHTTIIGSNTILGLTQPFRRPDWRPKPSLCVGGQRNASYEAGEDDSGHISAGPNEGIFFFDSELVRWA
jgi:hypothetical protein